jgi:hypothetical protein
MWFNCERMNHAAFGWRCLVAPSGPNTSVPTVRAPDDVGQSATSNFGYTAHPSSDGRIESVGGVHVPERGIGFPRITCKERRQMRWEEEALYVGERESTEDVPAVECVSQIMSGRSGTPRAIWCMCTD